jgi:hypothetical protein
MWWDLERRQQNRVELEMIDLLRLVDALATSLLYTDPAFPDRPLVLHAAPPRDFDTGTPVLFVHHGVRRNGRDYRDYWLDLVDEAGVLAISVEFPERLFPDHLSYQFGNLHNPREQWTFSVVERLFDAPLAAGHHDPATVWAALRRPR